MDVPATINYEDVLADLESRRAQIDAAIEAVKQIIHITGSVSGGSVATASVSVVRRPSESEMIRADTFFRMGIGEAAAKYLKMAKAPKTLGEIAEALTQGGITHASKNFNTTLHVALSRAEEKGILAKVKRGQWGLAEWYPGLRSKKIKEEENVD